MARKITKRGHAVQGALASHLAPRLAADKALKPGEITQMLLSLDPKLSFKEQIPLIVDSVKTTFKNRLAKDEGVEDLEELLEALGGEDFDEAAEVGEDEDLGMDSPEEHGKALMEILGKCNLPPDVLEAVNQHINALAKPTAPVAPAASTDELPTKPVKPTDPSAANAAPMKEVPVSKPAMDKALAEAKDQIVKDTKSKFAELFNAARDVEPIVGRVDALAFDSASDIYKLALDAKEIPTKDVHPSAYKAMLDFAKSDRPATTTIAADASAHADFDKRFPNQPARA